MRRCAGCDGPLDEESGRRPRKLAFVMQPWRSWTMVRTEGEPIAGRENGDRSARPKVFGIGFHKTCTTSLATALTRLG